MPTRSTHECITTTPPPVEFLFLPLVTTSSRYRAIRPLWCAGHMAQACPPTTIKASAPAARAAPIATEILGRFVQCARAKLTNAPTSSA